MFLLFEEKKVTFTQAYSYIKCTYFNKGYRDEDEEQMLKSSDRWRHWACIFITLQKQMFSENFRLFIDFHL